MNTPHLSDFESSKLNVLKVRGSKPAVAAGKQGEKGWYGEIFTSNPTHQSLQNSSQTTGSDDL